MPSPPAPLPPLPGPTQILSDCPHCLVEAALIEVCERDALVTPAVVTESQCRLCGFATERGRVRTPPHRFRAVGDVIAALSAWANEEGDSDVAHFCLVNFSGLTPEVIAARVLARERVETGFDVIAFLFPQAALAAPWLRRRERIGVVDVVPWGGGSPPRNAPPAPTQARAPPNFTPTLTILPWEEPPDTTGRVEPPPWRVEPPRPVQVTPPFHLADLTRAFWTIILADGDVHPREERLLGQLLTRFGAPTLPPEVARVHRPAELGRPPEPGAVLAAMEQLARCDGVLDRSEVRVLREYARAWGLAAEHLRPPGVWAEAWAGIMGQRR